MRSTIPARALAALTSLVALALLWELRPPLTEMPPLSATVTSHGAEAYGYLLGWIALGAVTIGRILATLRSLFARHAAAPYAPRWLAAQTRPRPVAPLALQPRDHPVQMRLRIPQSPAGPAALLPSSRSESEPTAPASQLDEAAEAQDPRPRVLVLGPLAISGARRPRRGLRAAALELIAYLALHPHGAGRDELLEAFWPEQDPRKSRGRLYQATRDARRLPGETAITNDKERYILERSHVAVDADELGWLLALAERTPDPAARAARLEQALELCRDEPLAGADYRWAEPHLRRLRGIFSDLLAQVGNARLEVGDAAGALEAAERGLAIDALNEELWRLALSAEAALGLREAVAERYERLRRLTNDGLGLEPASETRRLYRDLLGQV